jgi:hypothetical protein
LKTFQLFIIRPATSPDQSEQKSSTDGACADFVLFRSGPIRCLFSGVEISFQSCSGAFFLRKLAASRALGIVASDQNPV